MLSENLPIVQVNMLFGNLPIVQVKKLLVNLPIVQVNKIPENLPIVPVNMLSENLPIVQEIMLSENLSIVQENMLSENQPIVQKPPNCPGDPSFSLTGRQLQGRLVPMLAGLMELDAERMWTFERFFQSASQLTSMLPIRLFLCCSAEHCALYVDKMDS
ncbi:hypothetical protein MAR_011626 [Mya arenaria]|uniref:Uncharacterized protein n=1 Tax=Mya arenaria TaxID=6604 RepID=A0ABY7FWC3_MYAAR|nr:hypothetical protein MAR_011626 [Mya arenaria]